MVLSESLVHQEAIVPHTNCSVLNHLHGVLDQRDQSLMPRIVARMRGEDRVLLSFNLSFVCFGQPEGGIRSPELE